MAVNVLGGDGVEVAADEQGDVGRGGACVAASVFLDQTVDVTQEVGTLCAAEPLPAGSSLQMRHGHAEACPCALAPQHRHHGNLQGEGHPLRMLGPSCLQTDRFVFDPPDWWESSWRTAVC